MNHLRKIAIVIFSAASINIQAQLPWTRISPTPQEHWINEIILIPGTNRLVAACEGSTIMMSDDAGETWELIMNPAGMNNEYVCKGTHFINETVGFLNGGRETIMKTEDGGQTWYLKYQGDTIYEWKCINDLVFLSYTHGFAVGDNGLLLETFDAGEIWQAIEIGILANFHKIVFVDSLTGFIFSWNTDCLKTSDGGLTWIFEPLSPEINSVYINDCYFVNNTIGFVFSEEKIFKTIDAGNNWSLVHTQTSAGDANFSFFDDQHGIMAFMTWGYATKFLRTENGGNTWNEIPETWLPWWSTIALICLDQNTALTGGIFGMIYKSIDGGSLWQPKQYRLISRGIFEVQFLNENIGYILTDAGDGGVAGIGIKKTIDGGNSWDFIYTTHHTSDLDFHFLTEDIGYGITPDFYGEMMLIQTTDGGGNWTEITTGSSFTSTDIKFYDESNGLICGETIVIRTSDGGLTWQGVTPASGVFYAIEYRSANEAFIAGYKSGQTTLFGSTDGGSTWQTYSPGNYGTAVDLALPDENTILIATGQKIFKSVNNGLSWNESIISNPDFLEIKSLHFSSPTIGYAMGHGAFANMLKTTDGGDTWFPLETMTTSGLNTAWFFNDDEGFVFGANGIMLSTTTGGVTGTNDPVISVAGSFFIASPNPFENEITIRRLAGNKITYPVQIVLADASGRQILEKQITSEDKEFRLSGTGLKPGVYFCRLTNRNGLNETLKLVKIR
jgi:photosystem II stability/assembly factor-like uncharacterized protein